MTPDTLYHSPTVTHIRITEMFDLDPASWCGKSGPKGKRDRVLAAFSPKLTMVQIAARAGVCLATAYKHTPYHPTARDRVLAAYAPGMTTAQVAAQVGVHYGTASQYLRSAGIKPVRPVVDPARYDKIRRADPAEVIAAARTAPNFSAVADRFGISRERVRQLADRHEAETGEHIERGGRDFEKHPLLRTEQPCAAGCGTTHSVIPARARENPNWYCPNCGRGRLPRIEDILRVAETRIAGATWAELARREGYDPAQPQTLTREVAIRLRRAGRRDLIAALWPAGPPRWLERWL